MFKEIVACVASQTKLIRLDEYAEMGFPGYTPESQIHIVFFRFEPVDLVDCEYHLEGALFHLNDNKQLHSGLRLITMPAYAYFGGLIGDRMPTKEDVAELDNLPIEYRDDGDWMGELFISPNQPKREEFACFATVTTSSGPMLYEDYAELGFPGMTWNTRIQLFHGPFPIQPTHMAQHDKLMLAERFFAGEDAPEGFDVIQAYAYEDFDNTTAWRHLLNHKKFVPNLQVPRSKV